MDLWKVAKQEKMDNLAMRGFWDVVAVGAMPDTRWCFSDNHLPG